MGESRKTMAQPTGDAPFSPVHWGILGTGDISSTFATEAEKVEGARLHAVASRSLRKAQSFAEEHDIPRAYEGLDALCADSQTEIIYVATPTTVHRPHTVQVLNSGKGVLCEKPFGKNTEDARTIVEKAQECDLFCMEAMWMRFNPLIRKAKDAIADRRIGTVRHLHAELGYKKDPNSLGTAVEGRGALLAFGCYGVSLALYLFGRPHSIQAGWISNASGGDETVLLTLHYDDLVVSLCVSERVTLSNDVRIQGTEGSIHVGAPFIDATELEIIDLKALRDRSLWTRIRDKFQWKIGGLFGQKRGSFYYTLDQSHTGFRYEIKEATRRIRNGEVESSVMPLDETLAVHRILDEALQSPLSSTSFDW